MSAAEQRARAPGRSPPARATSPSSGALGGLRRRNARPGVWSLDAGYRHELADADHVRLAELLQGIAGVAVVSGYDCPLYEALYTRRGWRLVRLRATDQAGGPRTECLWLHPRCAAPDPPRTRP